MSPAASATEPRQVLREVLERLEGVESQIRSLRNEHAAFLEEADAVLQAVERKRKAAASSLSRIEAHGQALDDAPGALEAMPLDREEGKRRVRALLRQRAH